MCYHTALTVSAQELARRYKRSDDLIKEFRPAYRISAFSHAEYPIVTADARLLASRWGLIPFWTHDLEDALTIRNRTPNARAETVFCKPSFRTAIREGRCLVPVSGFFEWRLEGERKIPYYITLHDEAVFSLAGICDTWRNPVNGEDVCTYSVLTIRANRLMAAIDNRSCRMPVILPQADEEAWLDPRLTQEQITAMLRTFPHRRMKAAAVGSDLLKKSPYDPGIIRTREPVEA